MRGRGAATDTTEERVGSAGNISGVRVIVALLLVAALVSVVFERHALTLGAVAAGRAALEAAAATVGTLPLPKARRGGVLVVRKGVTEDILGKRVGCWKEPVTAFHPVIAASIF